MTRGVCAVEIDLSRALNEAGRQEEALARIKDVEARAKKLSEPSTVVDRLRDPIDRRALLRDRGLEHGGEGPRV